jgi:hypothetical protein
MILSYGVLTSHAGKIRLTHFGGIDELTLTHPETKVSFPTDFTKTFGTLGPAQEWREVNIMSDFTVDAPVMEAMYTEATGLPVNGVIQVDPAGLGAILAGIGPAQTADLGQVTAANVVPLTLSVAYQLYPNRTQRQDYAGEAAQAAFQKLTSGRFSGLRPLGTALVQIGSRARHLQMYTDDPTDESLIRTLGFDGALPTPNSDFAQLTIENFGANKLDYYLHSTVHLEGARPSPLGSHVRATIDLVNGTPVGQTSPVEVFGPFLPGGEPGRYTGLVTLYLPAGSYAVGSHSDANVITRPTTGTQNGIATVSYTVSMPAGATSTVVVDLYIPPSPAGSRFVVVPSPRVIQTKYEEKFT